MDYSSLLSGGSSKGNKNLSSAASDTIISPYRGQSDNVVLYIVAGLAALIILVFVSKR